MNKFIFIVLILFTSFAFATNEPVKKQIPVEDNVGKFEINLEFAFDRPITQAINMDVNVLCKDLRGSPNAAKPVLEKLLDGEKICAFDDYKFDKDAKILTLSYSTGHFEKELASCDEHWKQEFNINEICEDWDAKGARKPANELADGDTDFSSSNRHHHRGVGARSRVAEKDYSNSWWGGQSNPNYDANSLVGGSATGSFGKRRGSRDGLPRNERREVVACPGLGVSGCMSAIIAAESSCDTTVPHRGHGIGLCAIENDKRRFRFGSACNDISSTQGQINCCNAIYAQQGMKYFGGRTRRIARAACGT